jgi:hypothetical protein
MSSRKCFFCVRVVCCFFVVLFLSEDVISATSNQVCITLVSCNSMLINTPVKLQADEYVCSDIDDFIRMERHRENVVENMIMTELKGYDKSIVIIQHENIHD